MMQQRRTLVANVTDAARDYLEAIALAGRAVMVPVERPPVDDGVHELEIRTPTRPALRLLARLAGAATDVGVPLLLQIPPAADPTFTADGGDPLVGRELASGKLHIEALVGQGGAGSVYRARHRDLRMSVAVKVMHESYQRDAEFCRRFHAEALSASRLDHGNLTRVLDFGQEPDGLLYIAMEFLDGQSLRDILDVEKRLPFERVANILIQVCSGLTHAHARNIIHRDIKPENLVIVKGLDDNGKETEIVKVCDFGIAHREATAGATLLAGTAEYMAPELFRGEAADVRSDVYACGVVLYELLTGGMPIPGELEEVMARIEVVEPEPPSRHVPGLDARVDRVVMKAIAKQKQLRYAGARELREALRTTMEEISLFSSGGYWGEMDGAPVPSAAPEPASTDGPDWLERGGGYVPVSPVADGSVPPTSIATMHETAPAVDAMVESRQTAEFLQRLMETTTPEAFGAIVAQLEPRVRAMMAERDSAKLWRLRSTLDVIANEASPRAAHAHALLRTMRSRELLGPIAERALDGRADRDGTARKMIARSGKNGAYALYGARLKEAGFEARERFVAIVEECGHDAMPMIRAALERLETRLGHPGAAALAEDLLKALPRVPDPETGNLVARYAQSTIPGVARLATTALPKLAGVRARMLLVALVDHRDDAIAISAIKGLAELDQIDEAVIRQLEPLVLGELTMRTPPRIAAVEALARASHDAILPAQQLLVRTLHQTTSVTAEAEDLVACAASSFLAIGGSRALVLDRAQRSTGLLRKRLDALLGQYQRGG